MSEIAGATFDFTDYSAPGTPRTMNVPDGAGDITVQDIWDTYSAEAAKLDNLIYKRLIDRPKGGGKSALSPTKSTGITLMANNIQVKFPDQPGPTYVIKRVQDGNLIAQDHLEAPMEAIASSDFTNWKNEADVSAGLLTGLGDQVLDLSNGIETGITLRQAMRVILSGIGGLLSGAGTTEIVTKNAVNDSVATPPTKDRITATVTQTPKGNRTVIVLDTSD